LPIYEYQCRTCQLTMDIRHGFGETANRPCSSCGGELIRRFNATGIVFKGSGFYVTDSRKSSRSGDQPAADAASKASDESAKGDVSSESTSTEKSAGGPPAEKAPEEKSGSDKVAGGSADSSGSSSGASSSTAQSTKTGDSAA